MEIPGSPGLFLGHVPQISIVTGELPALFDTMRQEACDEGYRFIERLALDWASGAMRFDWDGEVLLAACLDGVLAGIGGLTLDSAMPSLLRMRRFYVRPAFRRQGVGRKLAVTLLQHARLAGRSVTVNAGTADAPSFWEAVGFIPDAHHGHTHKLDRGQL